MRRRLVSAAAALSFIILLALVIWQGSFRIEYSPSDLSETVVLWGVSTVIFLLTVALAFMLFRALVKGYIDRQRNREGSRIRSKLLAGALLLTLAPTLFYVMFSVYVLNRHLDAWFILPAKNMQADLAGLEKIYRAEAQERLQAETNWISLLPETRAAAVDAEHLDGAFFSNLAKQHGIQEIALRPEKGAARLLFATVQPRAATPFSAEAKVTGPGGEALGLLSVTSAPGADRAVWQAAQTHVQKYSETESARRRLYRDVYFWLICLITLFVLFLAAWSAQLLSRQISIPISALLGAAREVRRGNLAYRVRVNAIDELATLVRAFNEMTDELDANARELERRRRFTEAILESIPTGVISVSPDEEIERVNRALNAMFPEEQVAAAKRLADLFSPDDLAEIRYLMKRARRTGAAGSQLELQRQRAVLHLTVTVASLEAHQGFVIVMDDTSELLRGQKAAAWQEVARRIAHEIKNPLTPISLCADRMARQLMKVPLEANARAILEECTGIIQQEVLTVKSLVDEFSQFSRFPAVQPVPCDLNEIVDASIAVFAGRLQGISVSLDLDRSLPPVLADKEQMRRVIVNLVDNAAEAMNAMPVRKLRIATVQSSPEVVELSITDTGMGVSAADKEKLFLPYFSTKSRGTGLGLAIVSRIVTEHGGRVRVEDNLPTGTRFLVELNAIPSDAAMQDLPTAAKV